MALLVGHTMFRSSVERADGAHDLSALRVDRGDLLVAAIRSEDAAALVVEHDQIGIFADRNLGDLLERLEIENDHRSGIAFADEPAAELLRDRCAVHVGAAADGARDRIRVKIDDDDFLVMADIQTPSIGIGGRIVPPVIAGDGNLLQQVIPRGADRAHSKREDRR